MSSSLNVLCAICSEFYKSTDNVYSTTQCGHLFHYQCLFRWLAQSPTCPQCRRTCHRNRVHRVYLNFGERTAEDDELDAVISNHPNWFLLDEAIEDGGPEPVPDGAIKIGTDLEGNDAYVARIPYGDDLLPANYVPKKGGAYTPWGCHSHFMRNDLEVLLDPNYKWMPDRDGHVPPNALITGYTESGENLYTGRAQYKGITLGGKIHPSHGVLYMPYDIQEVNTKEYEVLVRIPKEELEQPTQQQERVQQQNDNLIRLT